MSDWFTVERLDEDTYVISEYGHWEETHCYLLVGSERAALIDTGLGVADIRAVVQRLTDLPVIALTTHAHWDHIGGHGLFSSIGVHELEERWLTERFPVPLAAVKANLLREPCEFPPEFDPAQYRLYRGPVTDILHDGDEIDLGHRRVSVLHTPGHSPGHCCFYEPTRGTLYSGDLIYRGCLYAFYPTTDPVAYMHSVHRVAQLAVDRLLPGHHELRVSPALIQAVDAGFQKLSADGQLKQGNGVFDFGDFSIQI